MHVYTHTCIDLYKNTCFKSLVLYMHYKFFEFIYKYKCLISNNYIRKSKPLNLIFENFSFIYYFIYSLEH